MGGEINFHARALFLFVQAKLWEILPLQREKGKWLKEVGYFASVKCSNAMIICKTKLSTKENMKECRSFLKLKLSHSCEGIQNWRLLYSINFELSWAQIYSSFIDRYVACFILKNQ